MDFDSQNFTQLPVKPYIPFPSMRFFATNVVLNYKAHHYIQYALWYAAKKNDTNIRNIFLKCVCGAACTANRKGSSANRKASSKNCKVSPKMRKAFSEERWICTNIRFFQSCICVFRAVFVSAKQNSNGKLFHKCVSFLKTHTVCFFLPKRFLQSTVQPHQSTDT